MEDNTEGKITAYLPGKLAVYETGLYANVYETLEGIMVSRYYLSPIDAKNDIYENSGVRYLFTAQMTKEIFKFNV